MQEGFVDVEEDGDALGFEACGGGGEGRLQDGFLRGEVLWSGVWWGGLGDDLWGLVRWCC